MSNRPLLVINDNPRLCQLVTFTPENAAPGVLSAFDAPTGIETARAAQPAVAVAVGESNPVREGTSS